MTDAQLGNLLVQARERNATLGITGLLLYRDGNFIQTIEGPSAATDELMTSIRVDSRHRGMIVMLDTEDDSREFGNWAMGFRHTTRPDPNTTIHSEVSLHPEVLEKRLDGDAVAKRLLGVFIRNSR
jgi:hypothetical protein